MHHLRTHLHQYPPIAQKITIGKADTVNLLNRSIEFQALVNFPKGDAGGAVEGEGINSSADAGEGDGFEFVFPNQPEAVAVAVGEVLVFIIVSAVPHGADGVDDKSRGQIVAGGDLGFAGIASAEGFAVAVQPFPRRAMDGGIHTAPAEQGRIGGIDNGIDRQRRNIALNDFDLSHTTPSTRFF